MMTDFWVYSVGLLILALLILVIPIVLLRWKQKKQQQGIGRKALNVAVYKDRINELEKEKEDGVWTGEQFEKLSMELKGTLLDDVDGIDDSTTTISSSGKPLYITFFLLIIIIPVISYSLYGKWGSYNKLEQLREFNATAQAAREGMSEQGIIKLLTKLKRKLLADPGNTNNADGWYMLAKSYMQLKDYKQAAESFSQLAVLVTKNKEDPSAVYGMVAQARYFQARGVMTKTVKEAIKQALTINPNEVNTLGLLGVDDFDHQRYEAAIKKWSQILEIQPDSPSRPSIVAGLLAAQKALKAQGKTIDIPALNKKKAVSNAKIMVSVTLSDALKSKVKPGDVLFIFAKAIKGPPIPLAVSKKHVSDLPLTITLDDSMAMSPATRLSSVPRVNIIARISKSGRPVASSGDLEGIVKNISTSKPEKVNVIIDKAL